MKSFTRFALLTGVGLLLVWLLAALPSASAETTPPTPSLTLPDSDTLLLSNRTIDTSQPAMAAAYVVEDDSAEGERLHLVQFTGPIQDEWLTQIEAAGASPVQYVAHFGYLVWADRAARQRLALMADEGEVLRYSGPYLPSDKLGPDLEPAAISAEGLRQDASDQIVPVTIQLLRHAEQAASEQAIRALAVSLDSDWEPVLAFQNINAHVRQSDIAALTALPDVVWVNQRLTPVMLDEVQAQILAGHLNAGATGPLAPGYLAWLAELGVSTNPADYPIIDIVDDGLGNGTVDSGDATLHVAGDDTRPSRVAYVANCTTAETGEGIGGHGHLNAAIAVGYDVRSGAPFRDEQGYQRGLGLNPFGRVASTSVFAPVFELDNCGGSYQSLIAHSYEMGARILNNSWGCPDCVGQYNEGSQVYDAAVRDAISAEAGNQALTIVFAAGNHGPDPNTITTPGNGKNIISVGASENVRPTWQDGCNIDGTQADNLNDMVAFSSRGPAPGERIKPDVVAPGSHVQATASTTPNYLGSTVCDPFYPTDQSVFAASSGTSHAAPAVAGILSLYSHWLSVTEDIAEPSPALLKAALMAATRFLDGVESGEDWPNNDQGWGLPDMALLLEETSQVVVEQSAETTFHTSGQQWRLRVSVADANRPVRLVMAYTDQAGMVGSPRPQVNTLVLSAEIDGQSYFGNQFDGAWSVAGGESDTDNNVQAIALPVGTTGDIDLTVTAVNVAGDGVPGNDDLTDQDFALVCLNCEREPDFTLAVAPTSAEMCLPASQSAEVTLTRLDGYEQPVRLSAEGLPSGMSASFDPVALSNETTSLLTLTGSDSAEVGVWPLSIVGRADGRERSASLTLGLYASEPSKTLLLLPAQDEVVDEEAILAWEPIVQASGYRVQIATDAAFQQVVATQDVDSAAMALPSLVGGVAYFWRVQALNACGGSPWSAVGRFETEVVPGMCAPNELPVVVMRESFEQVSAEWQSDGSNSSWQFTTDRAHAGVGSMYAEAFDDPSDQRFTSPTVRLPSNLSRLTLQFWHYRDLELVRDDGDVQPLCYDGAMVELSKTGGQTWQAVDGDLLVEPYDAIVSDGLGNPLQNNMAWCGRSAEWRPVVVDLDAHAGRSVQFRFRLGTDAVVGTEGWYVDEVVVQGCSAEFPRAYLPTITRP